MTEKTKIDKIIQENNFSSFMNESKWEKLFENLIEEFDSIIIRYKLIGLDKITEMEYDIVDFRPFFIEPVFYKEIEWIEFPQKMQIIINKRVSRQMVSELKQDVIKIEKTINKIGVFDMEKENGTLRLYGYK
ncbi:hypothetical protein CXF68_17895 [Tenacibaculum sp. Bg11-29]|uniref:DUF6678 family protein n=1 Tax=Tenacibaculum sp. Bg11-29 TaxID=2058306 RepID=UPI000C34A966|nr:DUF6678 family protein [Tenacibaculum sp. Bg11-29]PKH52450.1 hypothetical protein CXF68_17895 [Tenacibaculum sp. Bg11-29]